MLPKNIECDRQHGYGTGICVGRKFIATPFVLNYGFPPVGADSEIYVCDIDGQKYALFNYFDNEPVELVTPENIVERTRAKTEAFTSRFFQKTVVRYADPRRYKYSIELPDLWWDVHYVTDFDTSMYNYVNFLFYPYRTHSRRVRVVASFIDTKSQSAKLEDMKLLYDLKYYGPEKGTALVSVCSEHFKHTLDFYRDECFLRMTVHPDRLDGKQYSDRLRFDSGRNPNTNKYDKFTAIKTVLFGDALSSSLMEQIPCADYDIDC